MQLEDVYIEEAVEEKILRKHGVAREEIETVLMIDEPKHFKTKGARYLTIGLKERFITIVHENKNGIATVVTAYPSSKWQVKMYKRK